MEKRREFNKPASEFQADVGAEGLELRSTFHQNHVTPAPMRSRMPTTRNPKRR
jgi:hypothetical protein